MDKELEKILESERGNEEKLEEIKESIVSAVRSTHISGTKENGKGFATVSSSSMFSSKGCNMSPSYWLADVQAEHIGRKLMKCRTAGSIVSTLENMMKTGSVDRDVTLNPDVMEALKGFVG